MTGGQWRGRGCAAGTRLEGLQEFVPVAVEDETLKLHKKFMSGKFYRRGTRLEGLQEDVLLEVRRLGPELPHRHLQLRRTRAAVRDRCVSLGVS